jgi:hypothetical protein
MITRLPVLKFYLVFRHSNRLHFEHTEWIAIESSLISYNSISLYTKSPSSPVKEPCVRIETQTRATHKESRVPGKVLLGSLNHSFVSGLSRSFKPKLEALDEHLL